VTPQPSQQPTTVAGSRPHGRGWVYVLVAVLVSVLAPSSSDAQRRRKRPGKSAPAPAPAPADDSPRSGPADPEQSDLADPGEADGAVDTDKTKAKVRTRGGKNAKTQVFDFTGLNLSGSERKPQLLYFLDRAQEELKRASLERRSFVPEMIRSINEEAL